MTTEERDEMLTKLVEFLTNLYDKQNLPERHTRASLLWFTATEPARHEEQRRYQEGTAQRQERATAAEERTATALEGILQVLCRALAVVDVKYKVQMSNQIKVEP